MKIPPQAFDDRDGVIWKNGEFIAWRDATTHVLNHGLHYGSCVFEGLRVYNGVPFKLNAHSERLHKSAELIGFSIPFSAEELNEATLELIKRQNVVNGYVRPVAWRGSEQIAIRTDRTSIHTAIATWEWPSYFSPEAMEKGLKLTVSDWKRPSPETAPTASKAAGLYMICTMTKNKAMDDGFDDALMLDYRGYLAEATGANLFLVIDGALHTPTPDCFLNGITRQTVIELAKEEGLEVTERHIKPEELANAQEAFLTGSAAEITPIGSVNEHQFTVGNVTKTLISKYQDLVNNWQN